ncbi:Transmembrane protein PVRIG [Camelus dromedarius]|uniref:Transmembrane protein PVRIG n=1 Tax=Camelus dromedarius TaxID=9838 RepID=A0A5N4CWT0_CAMDR|nr:Transmembrane protein PVRIG [Camelus dromedarius]
MDRPRALGLLLALLTLCITAGTPEVWVQVQMEATESPSFTVRCGFLGSGSISLVTVSYGGPDGLPAPTPAPMLRADLAGILGVSGVLFFGCICLLYLLYRQRHWSIMKLQPPRHRGPQTQRPASAAGQASRTSLHVPYATINTNYFCPETLARVLPPQPLRGWAPPPTRAVRRPQSAATWAPLATSARGSFVLVENGLYAPAERRPLHAGPYLLPHPFGRRAMEGRLGVR